MRYRLLIIIATLIWGSSFVIVKDTTDALTPAWILAVRFLAAGLIMFAATFKKRRLWADRTHLRDGIVAGLLFFGGFYFQTVGIVFTTPGKNAFLTATYCVIVPFITWALYRKKPTWVNFAAALLCVCGIGLISLSGISGMNAGDALTLVGAVFFAAEIAVFEHFAKRCDLYVVSGIMFATMGAAGLACGLAFEPMPAWDALGPSVWASLAYLTIACSVVGLLFQNVAQAHLPAASAALLLSLESVFGTAFSVVLGYELLTVRVVCGFALVFIAIVISETNLFGLAEKSQAQGSPD